MLSESPLSSFWCGLEIDSKNSVRSAWVLVNICSFVSAVLFSEVHQDYGLFEVPHLLALQTSYIRSSQIPVFFDFELGWLRFRRHQQVMDCFIVYLHIRDPNLVVSTVAVFFNLVKEISDRARQHSRQICSAQHCVSFAGCGLAVHEHSPIVALYNWLRDGAHYFGINLRSRAILSKYLVYSQEELAHRSGMNECWKHRSNCVSNRDLSKSARRVTGLLQSSC